MPLRNIGTYLLYTYTRLLIPTAQIHLYMHKLHDIYVVRQKNTDVSTLIKPRKRMRAWQQNLSSTYFCIFFFHIICTPSREY